MMLNVNSAVLGSMSGPVCPPGRCGYLVDRNRGTPRSCQPTERRRSTKNDGRRTPSLTFDGPFIFKSVTYFHSVIVLQSHSMSALYCLKISVKALQ
jgi:hypothetical protein